MKEDKLSTQSMDFAVSIIELVKFLKEKRESIISNQIGRSGTSIGANIREAHYAHGKADFIAKLQIALKEANETGYWLELLFKTKNNRYYYRGLSEWSRERGYLTDTCLAAQDKFKNYLDYFKISY